MLSSISEHLSFCHFLANIVNNTAVNMDVLLFSFWHQESLEKDREGLCACLGRDAAFPRGTGSGKMVRQTRGSRLWSWHECEVCRGEGSSDVEMLDRVSANDNDNTTWLILVVSKLASWQLT